jgi:hypothetical protein
MAIFACLVSTYAWQLQQAPLMTEWSNSIDPNNV